jgi:hypothetical protein
MRTVYGLSKIVAFCLLALALGLEGLWAGTPKADAAQTVYIVALIASWIATALCIIRGAPVLMEAPALLRDLDARVADSKTQ